MALVALRPNRAGNTKKGPIWVLFSCKGKSNNVDRTTYIGTGGVKKSECWLPVQLDLHLGGATGEGALGLIAAAGQLGQDDLLQTRILVDAVPGDGRAVDVSLHDGVDGLGGVALRIEGERLALGDGGVTVAALQDALSGILRGTAEDSFGWTKEIG